MTFLTDAQIIESYKTHGSCHVVGRLLGISHSKVHRCLISNNIQRKNSRLTDAEKQFLQENYEKYVSAGKLALLATEMGRTRSFLCKTARKLGLTDISRPKQPHVVEMTRRRFSERNLNGLHPRGMLGKKHSAEAREKFSEGGRKRWQRMTEDERAALTLLQLKNKFEKFGNLAPNVKRGSWKAGWREVGSKRHFFRSRWEPNYARYLEWLKRHGKIADWQYEPKTFWFEAIKRGVRSYKPDFLVNEINGTSCWHEVKGWMDDRSKTALKRMAKYYPSEKIIVIDAKQYRTIESTMSKVLLDWETS